MNPAELRTGDRVAGVVAIAVLTYGLYAGQFLLALAVVALVAILVVLWTLLETCWAILETLKGLETVE